jgi:hypothetical protein
MAGVSGARGVGALLAGGLALGVAGALGPQAVAMSANKRVAAARFTARS